MVVQVRAGGKNVHIKGARRAQDEGRDRKWVTIAVPAIYQSPTPQGGGRDKMNAVCDTKLNETDGNTRKCLRLLPFSILNLDNILDISVPY